jgi:hypothetical protein
MFGVSGQIDSPDCGAEHAPIGKEFRHARESLSSADWVVELAGLELGTGGLWNTHAGALPAPGIPSSANARNVETCRSLSALGSNRPDPPPIVLGGITGAPF